MKTRILIAIHYLEIGGAEISLIGLLNSMDYSKYDVDLFVYSHRGEMMDYIPKEVNLLPENKKYSLLEVGIHELIRKGALLFAFLRIIAIIVKKLYLILHKQYSDDDGYIKSIILNPFLPMISAQEYDVAISFLTPHNIVLKKSKAKKKLAWIHTDYSTLRLAKRLVHPTWALFDSIVAVSDGVARSFISIFPDLSTKVITIENILPLSFVIGQSMKDSPSLYHSTDKGKIKLLSIGRFSYQKNFESIPNICKRLIEKGADVLWYIIGYGMTENLIRDKISENGMGDNVFILGKKANPYPYIKKCDIYVQPSRYEGKAVTVREAQMLHKPVVITNYPTASSQIEDGVDGIIVPMDNEGCANGIYKFILDDEKRQTVIDNLKQRDYSNIEEIHKLEQLLDD